MYRIFDKKSGKVFLVYDLNRLKKNNISGVGAIVPAGASIVPIGTIIEIYTGIDIFGGNFDGWTRYTVTPGAPIGVATGEMSGSNPYVRLSITLGQNKVGDKVLVDDAGIRAVAGTTQTGAGFPITNGSRDNANVALLQQALIAKGYNLGSWGADGDWGGATQTAVVSAGLPTTINSAAELQAAIAKLQGTVIVNPTDNGNNNTGGGTGITPVDTTQTNQGNDNTLLLVGAALVGAKLLLGKKGKKKRRR